LTKDYHEIRMTLGNNGEAAAIFGKNDEHLRFIENNCDAKIVARGNHVIISGSEKAVGLVRDLFHQLLALVQSNTTITIGTINYTLGLLGKDKSQQINIAEALSETIYVTLRGKPIKTKTLGQLKYVRSIKGYDLVFGIGPAGTGKTYLAVVMAVSALRNKEVNRIILTRPAVEAGEKLGFLPGDLQEKVNPYLRPLYDGLYDVLGLDTAEKYMERTLIEIAPLAYMRGRTLDDSFIILDEAQNTTPEQMKMFLTRIGFGSKAVITGDITQVDLPKENVSGLIHVQHVLKGIKGIAFEYLTDADVVRHPLVQKIIKAYEQQQ